MANYISQNDIPDDSIKAKLMDFDNADHWYKSVAKNLDVLEADIEDNPLPWEAKRALVFWVCCEVCRRNIGVNTQSTVSGQIYDIWQKRLDNYTAELGKALSALTQNVIMGIDSYTENGDFNYGEDFTAFERA